jgi:adenylate kinase family enzyme
MDHVDPAIPRRVVVLGTTGSGKTSFARRLARAIGSVHVEMDALFHERGWTPASDEVFRARVSEATDAPAWVLDGSYRGLIGDIAWPRADVIVWLDYSFPRVMARLFCRSLRRGVRREELWNGNRESLRTQFLTGDSLFLWARKSHWRHRREYPGHFQRLGIESRVVRLRSPAAAEQWLRRMAPDLRSPAG